VGPVWSPQSDRIAFTSNRGGVHDIYVKSLTAGESEKLLLATPNSKFVSDWSRDGRLLLFNSREPETGADILALPLDGEGSPFPVVQTRFREWFGQFSPDGRWIAYQSDESGRPEIYLQPFPGPGNKVAVSAGGAGQVRWSHDGKELFYLTLEGRLMAVPVRSASNSDLQLGAPAALFASPSGGFVQQGEDRYQYMVGAGGQRFLFAEVSQTQSPPVAVILHWKPRP
jgi:Tol biopolymer transport system component